MKPAASTSTPIVLYPDTEDEDATYNVVRKESCDLDVVRPTSESGDRCPNLISLQSCRRARSLSADTRVSFRPADTAYPERLTGARPSLVPRSEQEGNDGMPLKVNNNIYKVASKRRASNSDKETSGMESVIDSAVAWFAKFSFGSVGGTSPRASFQSVQEIERTNYKEFVCWQGEAIRPIDSPVSAYKHTADEYRLVCDDHRKCRVVLKLWYSYMSLQYLHEHQFPEKLVHSFCDCMCHDKPNATSYCKCGQEFEYNSLISIHRRKVDPLVSNPGNDDHDEAYIELVFKEEPRSIVLRSTKASKLRDEVLRRAKDSRNKFKVSPRGTYQ
eukprot:CFRG7567T1